LFTISWGANFTDFDQDGDLDLFVANGDLNPNCVPMYNFYFENENSTFQEQSGEVGLKDYGVGRGSVVFDLENDGDMDLLVVSQKPIRPYGPASITRLYKNELAKGNALQVKLRGNASTLSAFGSRIELYADSLYLNHEIDGGNTSHLSHNSRIAHFGLGKRTTVDSLRVTWPGGESQSLYQIPVNQKITVVETNLFQDKKKTNYELLVTFLIIVVGVLVFFKVKKKSLPN
jgi:hypothetical protein